MIFTFPLLVDDTVSPNIIPGICKELERFCLVYKTDQILKMGGLSSDSIISNIVSSGYDSMSGPAGKMLKGLLVGESKNQLLEYDDDRSRHGSDKRWKEREAKFGPNPPTLEDREKQRIEFERDKKDEERRDKEEERKDKEEERKERETKAKEKDVDYKTSRPEDRKVELHTVDIRSSMSIQPTWCTATSRRGSQVIGIKVVPHAVRSVPFVRQLLQDNSLSFFDRFLARYERDITRMFYSITRKLPFFRNTPLKQDPFEDIIYARSKYGKNIFCLLNLASLENDDMFRSQGGVDRLKRLGWNSLLIADDITKRIVFCMKEYGGLCEVTHYSFIYSSFGREGKEAYEKLEDLKKSTSPFFSQKASASKLFGESLANEYKERFSSIGLPCLSGDCE